MRESKALGKTIRIRDLKNGHKMYESLNGRLIWDTSKVDADSLRAVLFIEGGGLNINEVRP